MGRGFALDQPLDTQADDRDDQRQNERKDDAVQTVPVCSPCSKMRLGTNSMSSSLGAKTDCTVGYERC